MAPEQTLGKCHEVDARSDMWSVGATAFTLVSGRFVHDAETPEEMMVFNGSRQAQSLAEVAPDVASAFVEVVDRALRFDRTERWSSAVAMRAALVEACRSAHGPGLGARVLPSASK
jgi:serine/threonine-protein kinase